MNFVIIVALIVWIGGMLLIIAAKQAADTLSIQREIESKPKSTAVDWSSVYLMERAIWGHTFTHIDAPPDTLTSGDDWKAFHSGEDVVPIKRPGRNYDHWYKSIETAETIEEVNEIKDWAGRGVTRVMTESPTAQRSSLTEKYNRVDALLDIVDKCNERFALLQAEEQE